MQLTRSVRSVGALAVASWPQKPAGKTPAQQNNLQLTDPLTWSSLLRSLKTGLCNFHVKL